MNKQPSHSFLHFGPGEYLLEFYTAGKSLERNLRAVLWLNIKDVCGFKTTLRAAPLYRSLVTSLISHTLFSDFPDITHTLPRLAEIQLSKEHTSFYLSLLPSLRVQTPIYYHKLVSSVEP